MNAIADAHLRETAVAVRRMAPLLANTWQRIPAYQALWRQAGINSPALEIACVADFQRLPVITKQDLRRFPLQERCDRRVYLKRAAIERSGGSTGEPFEIPLDSVTRLRRRWRFLRGLTACGYRPGQRLMLLNTRGPSRVFRMANWFSVNLSLGEKELADSYRRIRPHVVYGPLNTLRILAHGLEAAGARAPLPRTVVSTAEQMTAADRRSLADAFGTDPADFYGMSECGLLAWRVGGRDRYTVSSRDFLLEFLPSAPDSDLERLVITDLAGGAMPLIRFDTGDLVCRNRARADAPIIAFTGRQVDCLRLPNGHLVSPYLITLALEQVGGMERYQVCQREDLSLDVTLWIPHSAADQVLAGTREALRGLLEGTVPIRVHRGKDAPPAGARKFRPVRSEAGARP